MTKTPQTQSDEALALAAQAGDEAALTELLARYRGTVWIKSASYFLAGGEHDDVVQEGMIGLYKAIRDLTPSVLRPFALLRIYASPDRFRRRSSWLPVRSTSR